MKKISLEGNRAYVFLLGLIILVYGKSLWFGYTYLDDNVLILDNLFFLKDLGNIFRAFQIEVFHVLHSSAAYYRPILTLSFMFDAQISGANLFFYHLMNILIHIGVVLFLYRLLLMLEVGQKLALFLSSVMAIHPGISQTVAWVPGRNDSLLALFLLLGFIFLIKYFESEQTVYLVAHFLTYFLMVFTKESANLFPVLMISFLVIKMGKKIFDERVIVYILVSGGISLFWFYMRSSAIVNPVGYSLGKVVETVVGNSPAVFLYLGKAIFPVNLSVLPTLQDSNLLFGVIGLVLILVLAIYLKSYKYFLFWFGIFWWGMFLLPSFVRPNEYYVADFIEHRGYVPMIGFLLALSTFDFGWEFEREKKVVVIIPILIIFVLSAGTFFYIDNFSNSIKFWNNAVTHSPSHPLAYKNLGAMYYLVNDLNNAEKYYLLSLKVNPSETMVHNNLSLIYLDQGDLVRAQAELDSELLINPLYDKAHFNYGILYWQMGEKEKAARSWEKTLEINPDHFEAMRNLAVYFHEKGEIEKSKYFVNQLRLRGL